MRSCKELIIVKLPMMSSKQAPIRPLCSPSRGERFRCGIEIGNPYMRKTPKGTSELNRRSLGRGPQQSNPKARSVYTWQERVTNPRAPGARCSGWLAKTEMAAIVGQGLNWSSGADARITAMVMVGVVCAVCVVCCVVRKGRI